MANPLRKMATVRRVDDVLPIEGADRIEAVRVGGWTVVDRKGVWKPGDLCVFYEIDTFLPTDKEVYAFLAERGTTTMAVNDGVEVTGHKLKTARLRGVYSQGLLMKPEVVMPDVPESRYAEMCDEGTNVSGIVDVWEYHKPMPDMSSGFIGRYDPFVAPRTDAERVQNVSQETFDLIKQTDYETSVKVDGTSITMLFDERKNDIRIFSHNNEFDLTNGMGKLAWTVAERQSLIAFCENNHMVTLQMELCGPKIQSNRLKLADHRLFVFSVFDVIARKYVGYLETREREDAKAVIDSYVPILSNVEPYVNTGSTLDDIESPDDLLKMADANPGSVTRGCRDEGFVIHVLGPGRLGTEDWAKLQNALGPTMQMKAVSQSYLLKAGD